MLSLWEIRGSDRAILLETHKENSENRNLRVLNRLFWRYRWEAAPDENRPLI